MSGGICQARRPAGVFDGGCNVTGCAAPTAAVVEVGGQQFVSTIRLCDFHRAALRASLDFRRFQ